jgi:hypothetical protein
LFFFRKKEQQKNVEEVFSKVNLEEVLGEVNLEEVLGESFRGSFGGKF